MANPYDSTKRFDAGCEFLLNFTIGLRKLLRDHFVSELQCIAKKEENRASYNKKWVLDTVEELSASEIEELRDYLEYLVWKSRTPTGSSKNQKNFPKRKRKGQPRQILEAINKSYHMTTEDANALLYSIKEGKIPMRFDSDFDESEGE